MRGLGGAVSGDDGAVLVMAGVLMVVLVGFVALVIDAAALYQERRELQNGADAAALAVAHDCAQAVACSQPAAEATADAYADDNAEDGAAAVEQVVLDTFGQSVSVTTSTEDFNGGTILAPFFARVLGYGGKTVHADAAAAWGHPIAVPGALPLIFSDCEWEKFGPPPPLPDGPPFTAPEAVVFFHGDSEPCHQSPSGQDLPGGFGWLGTQGICETTVQAGGWVSIDPGASPPNDCSPGYLDSLLGTPIPIPFFDDIVGTGNNAQYHVAGYGALWVTGYNFGGQFKRPAGNPPCSGSDRCISGHFVTYVFDGGDIGGEDRGVVIVKLTG